MPNSTRSYGSSIAALALAALPALSSAAVNYGTDNPASLSLLGYTQNFDSLPAGTGTGTAQTGGWYPTTGTDSNPRLVGWDVWTQAGLTTGTNGPTTAPPSTSSHDRLYTAGTTLSNTGSFYSLGTSATAGSNRALGTLASGSTSALYMGLTLTNDTGSPIDRLDISYTGEIWRSGGANTSSSNSLSFLYKLNPAGSNSLGTDTSFIFVPALKYNSPFDAAAATSYNGTLAANQSTITGSIDLSATPLAPGAKISLRWQAPGNAAATADALAVDNFSVLPHAIPEPASLSLLALVAPLARRRRRA